MKKMTKKEYLLKLVHQQVQPALGCTEIGIVSLCAAKAAAMLPAEVVSAKVDVSPYVYRNDGRVGVPKLGRCGMKTIVAAGLLLKNPEKKLNCLDDLTPKTIKQSKVNGEGKIDIKINVDYSSHPVYTRVCAVDKKNNISQVIVQYSHDNIISAKLNGRETLKTSHAKGEAADDINFDKKVDEMTVRDAYEVCRQLTLDEISFLREGNKLNNAVRKVGRENPDPESVSKTWKDMLKNDTCSFGFTKKHWTSDVLAQVAYAVDARMYGCPLAVMSSSRSGDHGLTVTIPQCVHADYFKIPELKMLQSIAFAHYITWKIKSKVGHLCGMCGSAVAAGAAATCGIAFQRDWEWDRINNLLNMHLASQAGIVCDGAKPSCSFKIMSSLVCGFMCLAIAENNGKIAHKDGIVNKDVEKTINNLRDYSKLTQGNCVVAMVDIMAKQADEK